jgi:hypothetical protein
LGQQTGPQAQATRGHLKRSEPARIWAYSLLDALDDFYADGDRPEIPVGEAAARSRPRAAEANGDPGSARAAAPLAGLGRRSRGGAEATTLSPAARSALLRRRILAGIGAVVLIALLVFGAIKLFGGGSDNKTGSNPSANTNTGANTAQGQQQGQVVAQAVLTPVGKNFKGAGAALVYHSGKQSLAVVRAKLPRSASGKKYVLWLYNNPKQIVPLAADVTDKQGNFQGAAGLPNNWQSYKFLDLTYQATAGKNIGHGTSVMRGPLTAPQQQAQNGGTGTGTGTSTTP